MGRVVVAASLGGKLPLEMSWREEARRFLRVGNALLEALGVTPPNLSAASRSRDDDLAVAGWIGLRTIQLFQDGQSVGQVLTSKAVDYLSIVIYVALIFVRPPIISGLALLATLAWLTVDWWSLPLAQMR